jgi:hypothetical protein
MAKNKEKELWNDKNVMTEENVDKVIQNFGHFTFKVTNSNAVNGGLRAEKVDLDGYVCMSSLMTGSEYEMLNNPAGNAKIYKRINAVMEGREQEIFQNINPNDVLYIKKRMAETIGKHQELNLDISNKRLKQIIIQKNTGEKIKNKELVILRSSGFSKVLSRALRKEREEKVEGENKLYYTRKIAQMSFGGTKPLNIGVNGYLMSNVLYFNAPGSIDKDENFNEAYKIHYNGLKIYDLISIDFLKTYYNYLKRYNQKEKINTYMKDEESYLITGMFNQIKKTVTKKYQLLQNNIEHFPNGQLFADNLMKNQHPEKLLVFTLIDKGLIENSDEIFLNCILSVLNTKTFYLEPNKPLNLEVVIGKANEINIRKTIKELLWQNI